MPVSKHFKYPINIYNYYVPTKNKIKIIKRHWALPNARNLKCEGESLLLTLKMEGATWQGLWKVSRS